MKREIPVNRDLYEATKLMTRHMAYQQIKILEDDAMSELSGVKKESLLVKMTNAPVIILTVLFYILSIAFTAHILTTQNKMRNIDAAFSQVGQALNAQAKAIEQIRK